MVKVTDDLLDAAYAKDAEKRDAAAQLAEAMLDLIEKARRVPTEEKKAVVAMLADPSRTETADDLLDKLRHIKKRTEDIFNQPAG
jgi:hypothetical protein